MQGLKLGESGRPLPGGKEEREEETERSRMEGRRGVRRRAENQPHRELRGDWAARMRRTAGIEKRAAAAVEEESRNEEVAVAEKNPVTVAIREEGSPE